MEIEYLNVNVYEAFVERMKFLFEEFDNIFVSFSGGKDSGLLLNLTLDFQQKYYPNKKIGVFHQDFEAQYTVTTEYIERTFKRLENTAELYWVCLPMATRTAVSNYEMYWYPWDDKLEDIWVRKMPEFPYVINLKNNPMTTYTYRMNQENLSRQFCRWYRISHGGGKTVCLLGNRASESLQRYSSVVHKKHGYKNACWTAELFYNVWTASPLYDWTISDVWHANYKFNYDYNRLYDMYYMAGLKPEQMRVASPFNDYAKDSLNLYRTIDPVIWTKLVGRVNGANFGAIYSRSKATGYRDMTLPKGHSWESYTKFLLDTLPKRLRDNYIKKFRTSMIFWHRTGGGLEEETIAELIDHGYNIRRNGVSNYTLMKKSRVIFLDRIPDDTDDIKTSRDVPSWKRMCCCILKNDHICRSMGFGITSEQHRMLEQLKRKYSKLGEQDGI